MGEIMKLTVSLITTKMTEKYDQRAFFERQLKSQYTHTAVY